MIHGQDWSSYQSKQPITAGLSFAFVKRTEGLSYTNPLAAAQVATARAAEMAAGHYHYPHIANSPAAEADYFLKQLGSDLQAGDILCLDWEWYGQKVTDDQARSYKKAFLEHLLVAEPTHRRVLYVDRTNWTTVDRDSDCGDGLWIADPTTAGRPRVTHPWLFHQYASRPVDQDVANFADLAALHAWAYGLEPKPKPVPKENDMTLTPESIWAYSNEKSGDADDMHAVLTAAGKAIVALQIEQAKQSAALKAIAAKLGV